MGARDRTYYDQVPNDHEPYNERRYSNRQRAAQLIADYFGVTISSAARTTIPYGGSPTSLHLVANGALADDFGAGTDRTAEVKEQNVCQWAATHHQLFQEVMWHDVTGTESAYHAHVAFKANVHFVIHKVKRALRRNGKKFK